MVNPNTARYEIGVSYQGYGHFIVGLIRHDNNFGMLNSHGCTAGTSNQSAMYWDGWITPGTVPEDLLLVCTPNLALSGPHVNPCEMQDITISYA